MVATYNGKDVIDKLQFRIIEGSGSTEGTEEAIV